MTGHAIPAISIEDLSKVLVLVPPKEVQKQISDEIAKVLSMRKEVFKIGGRVIEEVESLVGKMIKA